MSSKKIYIIAGEDSGDNLGAKLITQLKLQSPEPIEIYGIGGPRMAEAGLNSLFPMKEISLIGFVEIIPHLPALLKRIKQTVENIIEVKPDMLITIDSPGFNKRIARTIMEKAPAIKRVHYVAPTVWAYKPERAKKMARLFHHLLVLLPFEPPYFEAEKLPTTFTGHPVFEDEQKLSQVQKTELREKLGIRQTEKLVSLMVGSRAGEIRRLLPIYLKVVENISLKFPYTKFAFLVTENHEEKIKQEAKKLGQPTYIKMIFASGANAKKQILQITDAALVKSGTVSLEVAAAGVPMVITYKVSPFSAWMLRRMIKINYVTLINIIEDKALIPEFLQEDCTVGNLTNAMMELLIDGNKAERQVEAVKVPLNKLGMGSLLKPSEIAAKTILKLINN